MTLETDASFDFAFVDALPRRRVGAAELRVGLAEQRAASGPAFLFIPGAFHGAWRHAGWLRRCRDAGIACAALDYRGHGALAAEGLGVDTPIEAYAEDTVLAARAFAVSPAIVGHSLGGLVAMVAAMQTRMAGLALVAPSPPGNAHAIAAVDETSLRMPPARAEVLDRFLGGYEGPHVAAWHACGACARIAIARSTSATGSPCRSIPHASPRPCWSSRPDSIVAIAIRPARTKRSPVFSAASLRTSPARRIA